MYSVETLLAGIKTQFNILKHLGTKVNEENQHAKTSETTRTILELEKYLCYSTPAQVECMVKGEFNGDTFFQETEAKAAGFTFDQFETQLDKAYEQIETLIKSVTEEQRNETINVFRQTAPRNTFLVNYLLVFLGAYKTQLFLQLKSAGHHDLSTMNLWAGMDAPQKA